MAVEWIEWTPEVAAQREDIRAAVMRFTAPQRHEAGVRATEWLRESALQAHPGCVTRLMMSEGVVQGFYALAMSEVVLAQRGRKELGSDFPRQGAVLITWFARAENPTESDVAATMLHHAVAVARNAARAVGASVIALDPWDDDVDRYWRETWGFKPSQTEFRERPKRLWRVLFPSDG
ncbi:MAG: hypothetical protein M3540_12270 [Actinomycetota bacterium]|nr:hypothetical protein [Actinomycetota bacterium]